MERTAMKAVVIYHNPVCGTSRNVLALLREAGIEPQVIEYLKTPPDRTTLQSLVKKSGGSVRALLREKGTPFAELGLDDPSLSEEQLIDHILENPILLNRPIVVTAHSARLCRPSETVLEVIADLAAQDR
jgi:arsenate reductase